MLKPRKRPDRGAAELSSAAAAAPPSDVVLELPIARGDVVRVSRSFYAGQHRIDLRRFYRPADALDFRPTTKGINVSIRDLPALRAALQRLEASAIQHGQLTEEDFERHGLPVPDALFRSE